MNRSSTTPRTPGVGDDVLQIVKDLNDIYSSSPHPQKTAAGVTEFVNDYPAPKGESSAVVRRSVDYASPSPARKSQKETPFFTDETVDATPSVTARSGSVSPQKSARKGVGKENNSVAFGDDEDSFIIQVDDDDDIDEGDDEFDNDSGGEVDPSALALLSPSALRSVLRRKSSSSRRPASASGALGKRTQAEPTMLPRTLSPPAIAKDLDNISLPGFSQLSKETGTPKADQGSLVGTGSMPQVNKDLHFSLADRTVLRDSRTSRSNTKISEMIVAPSNSGNITSNSGIALQNSRMPLSARKKKKQGKWDLPYGKEELYEELIAARQRVHKLEKERTLLSTKCMTMEKELKLKEKTVEELQDLPDGTIGIRRAQILQRENRMVKALKVKVRKLEEELHSKEAELKACKESKHFNRLSELEVEVKTYFNECKRLQAILDSYNDENSVIRRQAEQCAQLAEKNVQLKESIDRLVVERADLYQRAEKLVDEANELRSHLDALKRSKEGEMEKLVQQYEEEKKALADTENALRKKIEQMEVDRGSHAKNVADFKAEEKKIANELVVIQSRPKVDDAELIHVQETKRELEALRLELQRTENQMQIKELMHQQELESLRATATKCEAELKAHTASVHAMTNQNEAQKYSVIAEETASIKLQYKEYIREKEKEIEALEAGHRKEMAALRAEFDKKKLSQRVEAESAEVVREKEGLLKEIKELQGLLEQEKWEHQQTHLEPFHSGDIVEAGAHPLPAALGAHLKTGPVSKVDVSLLSGQDLKSKECYVILRAGSSEYRSNPSNGTSRDMVWNEEFSVTSPGDVNTLMKDGGLVVEVYEDDQCLGTTRICSGTTLEELLGREGQGDEVAVTCQPLTVKRKSAGDISIRFHVYFRDAFEEEVKEGGCHVRKGGINDRDVHLDNGDVDKLEVTIIGASRSSEGVRSQVSFADYLSSELKSKTEASCKGKSREEQKSKQVAPSRQTTAATTIQRCYRGFSVRKANVDRANDIIHKVTVIQRNYRWHLQRRKG